MSIWASLQECDKGSSPACIYPQRLQGERWGNQSWSSGPSSWQCFRGAVCTCLLDLAADWATLPSPSSAWAVTQDNRPNLAAARSGSPLQYGFWFTLFFVLFCSLLREARRYSFFFNMGRETVNKQGNASELQEKRGPDPPKAKGDVLWIPPHRHIAELIETGSPTSLESALTSYLPAAGGRAGRQRKTLALSPSSFFNQQSHPEKPSLL